MNIEKKRFYHSLVFPVFFLAIIWGVKISGHILDAEITHLGIYPLTLKGLSGIILSPLIHADFSHLYANTVPFLTLGIGLFYFYNKIAYKIFFLIYITTGTWVWFSAREAYHIGASGIVYGLASFIFFSGIIRKDFRLTAVSLITVFLYGSMIWGIFPIYRKISWESHLMGGIAGLLMAVFYRKEGPERVPYSWESEPDDEPGTGKDTRLLEWMADKPYNDYTGYMKRTFLQRVQKISLNAGFTCPNRDGTNGYGGCTYCDNQTFSPFYCNPEKSVSKQLEEGIEFFAEKYKTQKYIAYFQAYTNTYAPLHRLKQLYSEALSHPGVTGLVIATRADAVNEEILDYIAGLAENKYIVVEFGVESTNDDTLKLINRGHTFSDVARAIQMTASKKILTGAHLILGLPGEDRNQILRHAIILSRLPLHTLKLHQLQIIRGTAMAAQFEQQPGWFIAFTPGEYIELVIDFLELLNPEIIVERFISESPKEMVMSPDWGGIKNFEIVSKIEKRMLVRNTWQGRLYQPAVK